MKENQNAKQMSSIPEENKRFMEVLSYFNYSGYKFAKEIDGVSESKITHIRTGRNKPSLDLINILLNKFPEVNKTWLLIGEGEMIDSVSGNSIKKGSGLVKKKTGITEDITLGSLLMEIKDLRKKLEDQKKENQEQASRITEVIGLERAAIMDVLLDLQKTLKAQKKENF